MLVGSLRDSKRHQRVAYKRLWTLLYLLGSLLRLVSRKMSKLRVIVKSISSSNDYYPHACNYISMRKKKKVSKRVVNNKLAARPLPMIQPQWIQTRYCPIQTSPKTCLISQPSKNIEYDRVSKINAQDFPPVIIIRQEHYFFRVKLNFKFFQFCF